MTTQSITLELPEPLMRRARQAADALQHPLEEVLAGMLAAALPDMDDVPPELQADLARMTWYNDEQLWAIAHSAMPAERQEQLRQLSELQSQRALAPKEVQTLEALRKEYGTITILKARAYALLSLRGGRPLLTEN